MIFEKTPERIDRFDPNPFIDGPAQYLCKSIARLFEDTPEFKYIFGDFIEAYQRSDFPIRNLPALRIYNLAYVKDSESWFINGDIILDVIWPANVRRVEEQSLQDLICSAIVQQFRNMDFFVAVNELIPGLNELGKVVSVNKALGYQWETEDSPVVPLTQITVNFRIDLRIWDNYLVETDRTKESPFNRILKNLKTIQTTIQAWRGEEPSDQDVSTVQDNLNLSGES